MESLQLSQVLADLGNLSASEPQTANAIVTANVVVPEQHQQHETLQPPKRPSALQRAWSSDEPKVDKFGRRILTGQTPPQRAQSGFAGHVKSTPGTPRRRDSPVDDDLERASTLMALYDIRTKLKQQDNSSLIKAREKINALAARQAAQAEAEKNARSAAMERKNRYSFPKSGL